MSQRACENIVNDFGKPFQAENDDMYPKMKRSVRLENCNDINDACSNLKVKIWNESPTTNAQIGDSYLVKTDLPCG